MENKSVGDSGALITRGAAGTTPSTPLSLHMHTYLLLDHQVLFQVGHLGADFCWGAFAAELELDI